MTPTRRTGAVAALPVDVAIDCAFKLLGPIGQALSDPPADDVAEDERRPQASLSAYGMKFRVELAPDLLPAPCFEGAALRVPPELQPGPAGELARLDDRSIVPKHARACGDVATCFDDTIIAQRHADAGVRADQAALADGDALRAAARQRSHDRGAPTDIAAVAHDDTRADAPLDHAGAERARIQVAEPLLHHDRAGGQMRAQ